MKKYNSINQKIIFFFSLFFLFSIPIMGLFTWGWADDFSLYGSIKHFGIIKHIINQYLNWDGRIISTGIIQSIFIRYLPFPIVNFIWGCFLTLSSYILYKIFYLNTSCLIKNTLTTKLTISALFAISLWYGMSSHISQTVYWATGGVYIFIFFLSLIWIYYFLKIAWYNFKLTKAQTLLFFIFTCYTGSLSFNLSCSLISFVFIDLIQQLLTKYKIKNKEKFLIKTLLLLLVGTLIIVIAPGNFGRASFGKNSFIFDIISIINNFIHTLFFYISISTPLIQVLIMSIPMVIIIIFNDPNYQIKENITFQKNKEAIIHFFQFPISAIASIIPFIFVPDFVSPRTSIYFMEFIALWILTFIIPIIIPKIFEIKINNKFNIIKIILLTMVTLYILFFQNKVITYISTLNITKNLLLKREKQIQSYSNKNVDVIVDKITTQLPPNFSFTDITEDKDNWINTGVSEYYNIKSIKASSN